MDICSLRTPCLQLINFDEFQKYVAHEFPFDYCPMNVHFVDEGTDVNFQVEFRFRREFL